MTPFEVEEVANFHEASHAVFATSIGVPIEYVSAYSAVTRSAGTAFRIEKIIAKAESVREDDDASCDLMVNVLMATMAGPIGSALVMGSTDWWRYASASDQKNITILTDAINALGEKFSLTTDELDEVADKIRDKLSEPMILSSIRNVAAALRERRQLSQKQIRSIVKWSHGKTWEGARELV